MSNELLVWKVWTLLIKLFIKNDHIMIAFSYIQELSQGPGNFRLFGLDMIQSIYETSRLIDGPLARRMEYAAKAHALRWINECMKDVTFPPSGPPTAKIVRFLCF